MASVSSTNVSIITDADFRKQVSAAPAGGYLFFGEEDYLKSLAVTHARDTLGGDESFRCFNEFIIDALDYTPDGLRGALMPLPMMADRKVVLLRGLDFESMKAHELDALCEVLAELPEYDYNTLLIPVAAGLIDEGYLPKTPSKILKRLGEHLTLVRYERCTPAKLCGWCVRHFKHNGVDASTVLCNTLIESCGRNMLTLASEIDKISYYVLSHGRTEALPSDISTAACTTTEYDSFAFANALVDRDAVRALDILADMKFRRVEPLIILGEVIRTMGDMLSVLMLALDGATNAEIARRLGMHEYKVSLYRKSATGLGESGMRRVIAACREADRTLKLSPVGYSALDMLICSI